MSAASYREQAPAALPTSVDADYDYRAATSVATPTPTSASARGWQQVQAYKQVENENHTGAADGEEALLDLVQLEELHQEAEKMKALGNKHMAAQEFTRAYNAYSAALQLSPVGPSSHVFLSNRAAALLSLKRYAAAATDAKRAVALAPTFGKAHARLGQALYFQKDYAGAVKAYGDAIEYEPDNKVTQTYLEKAKAKLEKQNRKARGEEVSVADTTQFTTPNSVVTDHNRTGVVQSGGYRGHSEAVVQAVARKPAPPTSTPLSRATPTSQLSPHLSSPPPTLSDLDLEEDPDFEEALKIQHRANRYLANKQYKYAIEEYTAALFLVPDDPQLSPDLHLGRAHALNGSRRHESARNDAKLAIRLNPSPAAYSTLAKSLFYMKDYQGAIDAFTECTKLLPKGESLGMFDKAYLQKAEAALEEQSASLSLDNKTRASSKASTPVPKLPPPRFVPREEAIQQTHNLPSMPKQWPQQIPSSPSSLRCGPERDVVFLSESLGIKLNRGPDGIVRVLSVTPHTAGSPVARDGAIYVGDVVREAAGVDIRRPITNVMWGDTVALVKMAPRPITLVVAKELSEVPPAVLEEQRRSQALNQASNSAVFRPSPANGDESVSQVKIADSVISTEDVAEVDSPHVNVVAEEPIVVDEQNVEVSEEVADNVAFDSVPVNVTQAEENFEQQLVSEGIERESETSVILQTDQDAESKEGVAKDHTSETECLETDAAPGKAEIQTSGVDPVSRDIAQGAALASKRESARLEEAQRVGEIVFDGSPPVYNGWDNLRWMSYSGARKLDMFQPLFRFHEKTQKSLFWSKIEKEYVPRALAIYEEPALILVLRRPLGPEELARLVGSTESGAENKCWVAESVVDPSTCKLHLSNLTTPTAAVPIEESDARARSVFEIITPAEKIRLSSVRQREGVPREEEYFSDSIAFLETTRVENSFIRTISACHKGDRAVTDDAIFKHQVILGTLHAYVLSGNINSLELALERARAASESKTLEPRILNALDESERPALYYACSRRMTCAVELLVRAGADASYRNPEDGKTLCHICACKLDDRALSALLTRKGGTQPLPNATDWLGRTPMYYAVVQGTSRSGQPDPDALERCIRALEGAGGHLMVAWPQWMQHPVSVLASCWRKESLKVVLGHLPFRFPLQSSNLQVVGCSVASLYDYPIHSAIISFLGLVKSDKSKLASLVPSDMSGTLEVLLNCGFEPNERLEDCHFARRAGLGYIGYSPLQLLGLVAIELNKVGPSLEQKLFGELDVAVSSTTCLLVGNGARLNLEAPPAQRFRTNRSVDLSQEEEALRASLKIDGNKHLLNLMGGADLLRQVRRSWAQKENVDAGPTIFLKRDDSMAIDDSNEPGGSSDKSCAICWKQFGSLINRKHKCRVSWRYVCDECSTKRLVRGGKEHRISDGQYLLTLADKTRATSRQNQQEMQLKQEARSSLNKNAAMAKLERLQAEEEANRGSLFGGAFEQAANYIFGEENNEENRTSQSIGGLAATMGETRNALLERGDKLASLGDKTSEMVDASANFAQMAKELRKKSEQGLFW